LFIYSTGVTQWDDPRECQDPVEVEEAIFEDDPELLAITKLNTLHNTGTVPVVTADGEPVLTETWSALVDPDSGYTYICCLELFNLFTLSLFEFLLTGIMHRLRV
jgi:hypothetical protein